MVKDESLHEQSGRDGLKDEKDLRANWYEMQIVSNFETWAWIKANIYLY